MQVLKEYTIEYLKRVAQLIYSIDILISIFFIAIGLIFKTNSIVIIEYLLMFFSFASVIFLICVLFSTRCLLMVKSQEKKYNITLNLNLEDILEIIKLKSGDIVITKDWLVCVGSKAFYRGSIKDISSKRYQARFNGYYIYIYTDNFKYTINTTHYHVVKAIKDWFKS